MNYKELIPKLIERDDPYSVTDAFDLCRELEQEGSVFVEGNGKRDYGTLVYDEENFSLAHELVKGVRSASNKMMRDGVEVEKMLDLYYRTHLFDAPFFFDSFCIYIEKDRAPDKQFYLPRRKQLLKCVQGIQDLEDGKLHTLAISLAPGVGKALADDTPILTRNGWKNHGDLVVGDEVIGMDGKFKKVIHVLPKCDLDVLVEFTNGEKIQCHENHEWMIYDAPMRDLNKRVHICETKRLEKRTLEHGGEVGHRGHRYIIQIPRWSAVEGEEKHLPLDPYTLGVWLGDGANKNPRICNAQKDYAIIERIVANGHPVRWSTQHKQYGVWYYDFDIRKELQSMGMCHSRKTNPKHIPQEYLTASIRQRLQLLAGLIDTDGTRIGSKLQFTTNEESLRDSFCELLATFGWRACVHTHEPTTSSSGVKAKKSWYTIGFTPDMVVPCALERKVNAAPRPQHRIAIKSITRVEPKQGNCITVEGDGMYLAGRKMIPTHNTTLAEFGLAWTCGRNPFLPNLIGSHNAAFLTGMYGEMLRIFDKLGEYRWEDVFPNLKVINTNAKDLMIGIGQEPSDDMRFKTLQFGSLGSQLAGRVRAANWMYLDDPVDGIETALNRERLDKLWQTVYTDFFQRAIGNRVKRLIIGTRWSLADPIGRLEESYENDPGARFIREPVLDENDKSRFDYPYGLGYTTEALLKQRELMDEPSWLALYQQQPIERDGQLYDPSELRRYFELPDREPDTILAICDTKEQGADFCVCPVFYQYGTDFYLDAIICDNGKVEVVQERVAQLLYDRKVKQCRIESNRGGTIFAQNVEKRVKELGGMTSITTKWTQTNKETRIQVNSAMVKSHVLFKDESKYALDKEYRQAMSQLTTYSMVGKNKHDDVPDALAMFVDWQMSDRSNIATIMKRPF